MARALAKALKLDSPTKGLPVRSMAEMLRRKGRAGDKILAHINHREARILKALGGSGRTNPDTGLPEFDDTFDPSATYGSGASQSSFTPPTESNTAYFASGQPTASTVDVGSGPVSVPAPSGYNDAYAAPASYSQDFTQIDPGWTSAFSNFGAGNGVGGASAPAAASGGGVVNAAPSASLADLGSIAPAGNNLVSQTPTDATPQSDTNQVQTQQKPGGGIGDYLSKFASNPGTLLAALGLGMGLVNQNKAQGQASRVGSQITDASNNAANQLRQLAQPLLTAGNTQLSGALNGQLSPVQLQAYQAAQAQVNQASAHSGGVGAAQATRVMEDTRQRLIANQYQTALQILGTAYPTISSAITTQLNGQIQGLTTATQLSQQANQATMGLYGAIGTMLAKSAPTAGA